MRKRILLILIALISLGLGGFVIWAQTPLGPMPAALAALQSDDQVQVETRPWLTFNPTGYLPTTGLILYPGGRVDPRSYAPLARLVAVHGYRVVIVPMPLNLAVFAPDRAAEVIRANPEIRRWAIGGHSLGGAMAAAFADNHPEAVQGLVLWASYPAEANDLSDHDLAATSIYGTLDGLATLDTIQASKALLPSTAQFVPLEGGNHAQFGWYGEQPGDGAPTIDREEQQAQILKSTLELLLRLGGDPQKTPTGFASLSPPR
jgi:pimeloyl-ACP methyl ester carboxylesterase